MFLYKLGLSVDGQCLKDVKIWSDRWSGSSSEQWGAELAQR